MNENLQRLWAIGKKDSRLVIGLMSGTSLDGLDVVLCKIKSSGNKTRLSVLHFVTVNYEAEFKENLKRIAFKETVSLRALCLLNKQVGIKHAAIVSECLQQWKVAAGDVDLIASHGQTVYHAPQSLHGDERFGTGTLQIGDADYIAVNTGIITISDFRQKNIAAGGEGAPLAAYGDYILFAEKEQDVILINIGGISNLSYLRAGCSFDEILCSDIGPGNTIMDSYMRRQVGKDFDQDAAMALSGHVHEGLLRALKDHVFFDLDFPKTTGPELFNLDYLDKAIQKINSSPLAAADVMATLNRFTASTISDAIRELPVSTTNPTVFLTGGGIHNPLLMENIVKDNPGCTFHSTNEVNINPDAKEAVLFAILANECVAGSLAAFGAGSSHFPAVSMGKISFPG